MEDKVLREKKHTEKWRDRWDTTEAIGDAIRSYLREEGVGAKLLAHRAESVWSSVVGPTVGRATQKVYMHEGVLHVVLTSSMVRAQLGRIKGRIIEEINKTVGDGVVKDIRFQ